MIVALGIEVTRIYAMKGRETPGAMGAARERNGTR